ncbi:carboxymuconolactone decarboxylase family protein [Actinoplanes sp. NBRC 101535]|uniref:carboxymuconolactone decarboxylase family protein n=1 Tax=Actinoplanes sp. NBRC 101535 TaxID=3032196 RepID=UPI0024A31747|nr:carboxymuconolactone decarboxylase family protein [Actinoplanes sp. NBRC 101535]GLY00475.1 alkyl hydroperoxide reductase AhpD [Actinoplanes sp. NBRC 101535]
MTSLFARGARRLSLGHIQHLAAVPPPGSGAVAAVYRQMENEFGMLAPPVALHAAAPEVLEAVWLILRETLLAGDPGERAGKEAMAAAVSFANSCPYCVEVHGAALIGSRPGGDAELIAAGRIGEVRDAGLRSTAGWGRDGVAPAGLDPRRSAVLTGVGLIFHYLNRMVNVFLLDSPLAPIPPRGRVAGRRVAIRVMGRFARAVVPAGAAAVHLPPRALPPDLAWSSPVATVADAVARGCGAIAGAGERVVPAGVRALLAERLADPAESGPGLDIHGWLAGATRGLPADEIPAARLALLVAYASYRVTGEHVAAYRVAVGGDGGDDGVVRFAGWAAMAAARSAAAAMAVPGDENGVRNR